MVEECLFCRIIKGDIPSARLYEDVDVLAFLDIFPISKGHTVVIPIKHYSNFFDFPDDSMDKYFTVLKKLAIQIKTNLEADGINIIQNNLPAAGQLVNHMHFHIIPRWKDDKKLQIKLTREQASPEQLQRVLKQIVA